MTKAAIKAVYTDYKRIKSRKVHQVVFEVPSEKWPEIYRVLGEPNIETSDWFGIAKMNVQEPAPTPKEQGSNLAANVAIMLKNPVFKKFLRERGGISVMGDEEKTANFNLKKILKIGSKSELNTNPQKAEAWRDLRSEFKAWELT